MSITITNPDDLDALVEFDVPFTVMTDNRVIPVLDVSPSVPECVTEMGGDLFIDFLPSELHPTWGPMGGHSNQYGYAGPVMHPSEFLGGGMARWVLGNPGTYVVTVVYAETEDDVPFEDEPVGWVLLRLRDNA